MQNSTSVKNNPLAVYLGVDPSLTNTCLVLFSPPANILKIIETINITKYKNKLSQEEKLYLINQAALSLINDNRYIIYMTAYEHYSYNSTNASFKLGELGGVLKLLLHTHKIPVKYISPRTVKKFAVNDGNASKKALQNQFYIETQYSGKISTDLADAFFLAKMAWYLYDPAVAVKEDKWMQRPRLEAIASLEK